MHTETLALRVKFLQTGYSCANLHTFHNKWNNYDSWSVNHVNQATGIKSEQLWLLFEKKKKKKQEHNNKKEEETTTTKTRN